MFLVEARDRLGRGKRGAGKLVERGDGGRQPQGRFRDGACFGLDRRLDLGALLEAPQDRSEGSEPLAQRFGVDRRPSCRVVLAQQGVALMLAREIGTKACELTLDRTPFAAQRAQQSELGVRGLAQLDVRRLRKAKPLGERLERRPHAHGFAIDAGQIFLGLGVAARLGEERGDLVGSRHERLVDRQPVAFLRELLDCSQAFAVLLRRRRPRPRARREASRQSPKEARARVQLS